MTLFSTLQAKIFVALFFLALIFISVSVAQNEAYENNLHLAKQSNVVHTLSEHILTLNKNNQNYIENAPRDYESYDRDLIVFNQTLQQDIQSIDRSVISVQRAMSFTTEAQESLLATVLDPGFSMLEKQVFELTQEWTTFKTGLFEKLGTKENEPRLEWGATFITENSPALSNKFLKVITLFDTISLSYKQKSDTFNTIAFTTFIVIIGIYLMGFYIYVISPLKSASSAFNRVSEGDYGYQIPNTRKDEIGNLTNSFNSMSSRTELVLSIISRLQNTNHPLRAVEEFNSLSYGYLKADFVGLLQVDSSFSTAKYSFLTPKNTFENLKGTPVNIHAGSQNDIFLQKLKKKEIVLVRDLKEYIHNNPDADLLKPLGQDYSVMSAIVAPIQSDAWQGILLVGSNSKEHFNQEQVDLIQSVSSLIAKGFHSSFVRAKTFQKISRKAS